MVTHFLPYPRQQSITSDRNYGFSYRKFLYHFQDVVAEP
jgi:hypothetical protein